MQLNQYNHTLLQSKHVQLVITHTQLHTILTLGLTLILQLVTLYSTYGTPQAMTLTGKWTMKFHRQQVNLYQLSHSLYQNKTQSFTQPIHYLLLVNFETHLDHQVLSMGAYNKS